jgi:hypothetical protein
MRKMRSAQCFFHSWILCGTCLDKQARQLIVNASKQALIHLPVTGWIMGRDTLVLGELPPPKHDVTEGFMAMVETKNEVTLH